MHDVFISFSFANESLANEIAQQLREIHGISCWICTKEIRYGNRYKELIYDAINSTQIVVLILTKESSVSENVKKEIDLATEGHKTIIPFMLEDIPLGRLLGYDLTSVNRCEAFKFSQSEAVSLLAADIRNSLGSHSNPAPQALSSAPSAAHSAAYSMKKRVPSCSSVFFGRDELLENIHRHFESGERFLFLRGMGGIGKSEIALQYAKKYAHRYRTIVFARYTDSLVKLISDDDIFSVNGFNRKIKEDGQLPDDKEYAQEKLRIIQNICGKDTLFIIDNFDVDHDPFLSALTEYGDYRILFTTRCDLRERRYTTLPIPEISDDRALKDMFIEYCGSDYVSLTPDDPAFDELFELTNRHTLTLELIAQYMCEKGCSLSSLVRLLKKHSLSQIIDQNVMFRNRESSIYNLLSSIFSLSDLSEDECNLMRFLSLMPSDGIEISFFERWCPDSVFQVRSRLIRRSWIKYDGVGKKLSLHPLIREIVHNELKPSMKNCKGFLNAFADDLLDYIAWNYPQKKKLVYFACCNSIRTIIPKVTKSTFSLHYHMLNFSCFVDSFENSIRNLNVLLVTAQRLFGKESAPVGQILFRIGWCHFAAEQFDNALRILEFEALPILEKQKNTAPGEYIHCCNDVAKLHMRRYSGHQTEERERAEELLKKSLELNTNEEFRKKFEIVRYRFLMTFTTLASFHYQLGDYHTSCRYIDLAESHVKSLPNTDLDYSALLFTQQMLCRKIKDIPTAVSSINRSLELLESHSGALDVVSSHSTRYVQLLLSLSEIREEQGDLPSARKSIKKAYQKVMLAYQPTHVLYQTVAERYSYLFSIDQIVESESVTI